MYKDRGITYWLTIHHDRTFVVANWVGKKDITDLTEDIMSCERLDVFLDYYGLVPGGCICYLFLEDI